MPKGDPAGYLPAVKKKRKKGLKDNAANAMKEYKPRSKQAQFKPDPHPSAKGEAKVVDTVKRAAELTKQLKKRAEGVVAAPPGKGGLSLRDAVRGRKKQYGTEGDRRLTYEEALARRTTDSSRARVAAKYGKTYTPGETRNTTINAAPGASKPTATINHPSKGKKKRRRFDSRG